MGVRLKWVDQFGAKQHSLIGHEQGVSGKTLDLEGKVAGKGFCFNLESLTFIEL